MNNIFKKSVKKVTSVAVLVAAILGVAHAQVETGVSGGQVGPVGDGTPASVKLNVVLNPVRTLVVANSEVNLVYKTIEDYENGVSYTTNNGHLQVTNIGSGYKIYVKSSNNTLKNSQGGEISGDGVTISGVSQNGVQVYNRRVSEISNNGATGVELFHVDESTAKNAVNRNFEVTYSAAGNGAYNDKVVNNQPTTYSVDIQYTILTD